MDLQNYDVLAEAVDDSDNLLTIQMDILRDIHGAGRLGKHVRENISDELRSNGLGHYPEELPSSQYNSVRIYRLGSPAGRLIEAVTEPGADNDETIRTAINKDAQQAIDRVQELVCDL